MYTLDILIICHLIYLKGLCLSICCWYLLST